MRKKIFILDIYSIKLFILKLHSLKRLNNRISFCFLCLNLLNVFTFAWTLTKILILHILMEICIWKLYPHETLFILKGYTLLG